MSSELFGCVGMLSEGKVNPLVIIALSQLCDIQVWRSSLFLGLTVKPAVDCLKCILNCSAKIRAVSYTHLTLPTNREV